MKASLIKETFRKIAFFIKKPQLTVIFCGCCVIVVAVVVMFILVLLLLSWKLWSKGELMSWW